MDGRGVSLGALVCALGLCLGASGCIPKQFTVPVNDKPVPGGEMPEPVEPVNLNPFATKLKREPKIELDIAIYHEMKAVKELRNNPEQQQRHFDLARKAYQEILVYDNKYLPAYRGLARVYVAQRDLGRAEETYRKALAIAPKDGELYQGMSAVYSKKGDFNGAIQLLNKALEFDPENREAMKQLGIVQVQTGQIDRGADTIARAYGRAAGHLIVARTLALTNRLDEAYRHAQLALQANPNSYDARAFAADLESRSQNSNPVANVGLKFNADQ